MTEQKDFLEKRTMGRPHGSRNTNGGFVKNPVQFLGLAMLKFALEDGVMAWLKGNSKELNFWLDCANIDKRDFKIALRRF